ncbi:MAG: hypothetical protein GX458_21640 [Phyllobacteriaceae bacterium]|nr:hypothetical protein [Phyllobacteriaceae bacterium]
MTAGGSGEFRAFAASVSMVSREISRRPHGEEEARERRRSIRLAGIPDTAAKPRNVDVAFGKVALPTVEEKPKPEKALTPGSGETPPIEPKANFDEPPKHDGGAE